MAVAPIDIYRIYADPALDADTKTARINMLYGAGAPPSAGPDLRTANVDPRSVMFGSGGTTDQPPAAPPTMSDAGGMSMLPPTSPAASIAPATTIVPTADTSGASSAVSEPTMSSISPEALAAEAASKASTPPPETPTGPVKNAANVGVDMVMASRMGGRPVSIAEHDQKVGSVNEYREPIPDALKKRLEEDTEHDKALALERGELEAKTHTDAALAADIQKRNLDSERAANAARAVAEREHAQKLDEGFEKLARDTEVKPSDWWASKDLGHKALAVISAVMLGLAQKPEEIQRLIDRDLALKEKQRDKLLGARKSAIDNFRSQMMSPEAANAADRALAAQAMAAEATRFAEAAKAPEVRQRGLEMAAQFQEQHDQYMAQMAEHEAKAVKDSFQHFGARTVGGPQSSAQQYEWLVTKGHMAPNDAFAYIATHQYNPSLTPEQREQQKHVMEVAVPTTEGLYFAGDKGDAAKAREKLTAIDEGLSQLNYLEGEIAKGGSGLDSARQGGIDTSRAALRGSLDKLDIKGDKDNSIKSLLGGSVGDLLSIDAYGKGGVARARQVLAEKRNAIVSGLYRNSLDPTQRGGVTAAQIEQPTR